MSLQNTKKSSFKKRSFFVKSIPPVKSIFAQFFSQGAAGGVLLLVFTVFSIAIANIPSLSGISAFFEKEFTVGFADFNLTMSLAHWVNDGLMVLFFFVVGLEIKRELMVGELSSFKRASLPIMAAVGGMLLPAIAYILSNLSSSEEALNGWGIPMATDIAFAIGILSILGKRVPLSLKIFLTALAIVDDLGAIAVIAIFYPVHDLHFGMLLVALGIMLVVYLLNKLRVQYTLVYVVAGIALWLVILTSGLHATIAGVLLAIVVPISPRSSQLQFSLRSGRLLNKFKLNQANDDTELPANEKQKELIHNLCDEVRNAIPPLQRFEHALHPWVMYFVMPLFALVNAGVVIDAAAIAGVKSSVSLGIFFGLLLGKPLGITLFSFVAVKLGIAELPKGVKWVHLLGAGLLAGIGFTMSIFIANLAFADPAMVSTAKFAILIASTAASLLGVTLLALAFKKT